MRLEGERVQILESDIIPLEGEPTNVEAPGRDRRIWQALQRFEAAHRASRARVVVGMPGGVFFVRPFSIFLVGTRTESQLVRFEMEQHMPFGLDAVLWDYEVFDPPDASSHEREGLLYAMKKDILNNYLLNLSSAKIEPAMVQAAPLALYNFVRHELSPDEPTLVVDIGAVSTTLMAVVGRRYWLRTINTGGDTVTAAIRTALRPREISAEDAELIKTRLPQLKRRGEMVERITPALRTLVGELRNATKHLAQEHKQTFDKIVLMGGGGAMYSLASLLSDELKMRVVVPAGLGRIEVAPDADAAAINRQLPQLATAIGLGLQGLG